MDKVIAIVIYLLVFMPMVGALVSYLIGRKSKKGRDFFVKFITKSNFVLFKKTYFLTFFYYRIITL